MLIERRIRPVVVTAIGIVSLFGAPTTAYALSCAARNFTLSEAYEAADSITVGVVTECRQEKSSDPWANGGGDCSFSSLDVLKESTPARDHNAVANSSGCGLSLHVGSQYLLFLDEKNVPLYFSARLNGGQDRLANRYVRIIRDFRNGVVDDLAEPWVFGASDGNCSIAHRVAGNQINFGQRTSKEPQQAKPVWTQDTIGGETVHKSKVPTYSYNPGDGSKSLAGTVEIVAFGSVPDYSDDALTLTVNFDNESPVIRRHAKLSVGAKTWSLERVEMNISLPGGVAHSMVSYHAAGNTAEQILAAMAKPSDIVVSATASLPSIDPGRSAEKPLPVPDALERRRANTEYFGRISKEASSTRPSSTPNVGVAGLYRAQKEQRQWVRRMESRSTQLPGVIEAFRVCRSRK